MTFRILRRRSLMTMACTALVAVAYGGAARPAARILRTETTLPVLGAAATKPGDLLALLPLAFERNEGQFDASVRFSARGDAYEVALGPDGVRLALVDRPAGRADVGVRFLDGRPARTMTGLGALPGRTHSYGGATRAGWTGDVQRFERVRATGVYDGIDVEYYGRDRQLEYDFLVAPGADPSRIAMAFTGVDRVSVDEAGDLRLHVGARTIRQHRPVAYQDTSKGRRTIEADYLILGGERVVIAIGDYDHALPLVIDPVLTYSSYVGGNDDDPVRALATSNEAGLRAQRSPGA